MPSEGPARGGAGRGRSGPARRSGFTRQGLPQSRRSGAALQRQAARGGGSTPLKRPVTSIFRGAIDFASVPAYSVGSALEGDFAEVGRLYRLPVAPLFGKNPMEDFKNMKRRSVSDVAHDRGLIDKQDGFKGLASAIAIDILTDPLTLASFGTAGVARGITAGASRRIALQAANAGRRPTFGEAGREFGKAHLERAMSGSNFTVGARIPFTRGKTVEAELFPVTRGKDPRKPQNPRLAGLRDNLGEIFASTRGASKPMRETYHALRRMAEAERRRWALRSKALDNAIRKREKEMGIKRGEGARAITMHIDNPRVHDAPEGFQDIIEETRGLLDEIDELEELEGIERGFRTNYVPHLLANRKSLARYQRKRGRSNPGALDSPFFVQRREYDTLDELLEAGRKDGFDVELNISNLVNARASASVTTRLKKGFDDAIAEVYGAKPPRRVVPSTEGAANEAAQRAQELHALSQKVADKAAKTNVIKTRAQVVTARARERFAHRTGDPNKVSAAREAVDAAEADARMAVQEAVEEARPRLLALSEARRQTEARLPRPSGGADVQLTPQTQMQVVEDFADDLIKEAEHLEAQHSAQLREAARERRDNFKKQAGAGGLDNEFRIGGNKRLAPGTASAEELFRHEGRMNPNFRTRNENLRTFDASMGKRREKRIGEFEDEIIDEVIDAVEREGLDAIRELLDEPFLEMVYAMHRARERRALAEQIQKAVRAKRGERVDPIFDEENARLAGIFDQLVEEIGGGTRRIDAKGRRKRATRRSEERLEEAGVRVPGQPEVAMNKAQTRTGRRAVARYFDQGEVPRSGIARDESVIRDEVEQIRDHHNRRVVNAQNRLRRAQKAKSAPAIKQAREELRRAKRARHKAQRHFDQLSGTYVGTPRQVIAATKRKLEADAKLARAERRQQDAIEYNDVLDARPGMSTTREEYQDLLETWETFADAGKYQKGTLLPENIAEDVRKIHDEITPQVKDVNAISNTAHFLNDLTRRWKALALTTLGFHIRNLQDDGLRAYWAGARNPASFLEAFRALRFTERKMLGKEPKDTGATITIKKGEAAGTYTYDEIIDLMELHGVIRTGFARVELGSIQGEAARITNRRVEAPGRGRIARASQTVGQYREDMTRGGLFIELLKRGDDPIEAAEITRRYLFDYGDVSQFIAGARRYWMPFIVFPSKAIPNTLRVFASRPGIPANLNLTIENLSDAAGNPDLSHLDLRQASSFAVPAPDIVKSMLGVAPDDELLFDPKFVMGASSLDLLDPRAGTKNVTDMLSPFITTPVEVVTNKSLFTGRDFPKTGARVPSQVEHAANYIPGAEPVLERTLGFKRGARDDFYTGDPIDTYHARIDAILRSFPPWGQSDAYGGGNRNAQNRLIRSVFGVSLKPAERARRQAAIEEFGED